MISENTKWFNQTLFTFKDKHYSTDGYLRLSMVTNTEDFNTFNPPSLSLSISNNYQKTITLHLSSCNDLIKTFKTLSLNGDAVDIQRKFQKDLLYLKFFVDKNTNERLVLIEIRSNETDLTRVIIPLIIQFEAFMTCIKQFSEKYMDTCLMLLGKTIESTIFKTIEQLPSLIKGISSQVISQESFQDTRAPEPESHVVESVQQTINDLDKFLGEDMRNVKIPEIEAEIDKKDIMKVNSPFVEKVIGNDLSNLENLFINFMMSTNPVDLFNKEISSKIYSDDESFKPLSGINEDDMKSISYLGKILFLVSYKNYLNTGAVLPDKVPVFKYKSSSWKDSNNEIAYDLLVFNLFIRNVRRRLEGKSPDIIANKALFYLQLRCFADPFVFSFIDDKDGRHLETMIVSRFNYYKSIGVFDKYYKLLDDMNCPTVTSEDVRSGVNEVFDNVVRKTPYIEDLHKKMFEAGNVKLPSKNKFTLEQIVNEIVPFEVADKTGLDLKKPEIVKEIQEKNNISDEIVKFMLKGKTKVTVDKHKDETNLMRIVKFYSSEIPDEVKDKFMQYIEKLGDKKYDFKNTDFDLDLFGEGLVKALYAWNPEIHSKNYKEFFSSAESELMSKELIVARNKQEVKKESGNSDWNFG